MLKTVEFIREFGLPALCDKYKLIARRHGQFPNLVQLKYDQIESPMGEEITQECRGLILDEADDWRVICWPYRKFFNAGEGHAAQIRWPTARVYEKLDGSLMTLYWYRGEWRVASSGMPDAAGPVIRGGPSFADLFWATFRSMNYSLPPEYWQSACFMFELMTPLNRIIVPHAKPRLVLHGARDDYYGEFAPDGVAELFGWECVQSFPIATFEDCMEAARVLNPMHSEGFVVCDHEFNRIKVKSPQYVALAHLKEGMSGRRLLEIVRANESSEFLAHFPEWTDAYNRVRETFDGLVSELETTYAAIQHIPVQKDFALEACKTRCSSALFALRAGKVKSVREYLATASLNAVERTVGSECLDVMPALQPVGG